MNNVFDAPDTVCELKEKIIVQSFFNSLNAELNPIRHLLALAGAHHFVDVSRIKG
jgi:hypothetical protein